MGLHWTIYSHIHSGRRYIGLTKLTMMKRWNQHIANAKHKRGRGCAHFWNAIRKYGKDAFTHGILEICDTLEAANAAEEKWINHFNTRDPDKGFNLAKGGDHAPHPYNNPWDRPEFREKMLRVMTKVNASLTPAQRSAKSKKLWQNPEFREKVIPILRNNVTDPAIKARIIEASKVTKSTPESKAKRSSSSKLMWDSEYRTRNAELWKDPEFRNRCQSGLAHGSILNKNKTHCPKGHEYSVENTVINSKGSRECLICKREWRKNWMRKHRVQSANA